MSAASNGVRPSNAGIGSSPSPSRHTNSSFAAITIAGPVIADFTISAKSSGSRLAPPTSAPSISGMRHEAADVARLDAAAVLHANRPADLGFAVRAPSVSRISSTTRPASDGSALRPVPIAQIGSYATTAVRACRGVDVVERPADLLRHLRLGAAGVALLQRLPHAHDRRHAVCRRRRAPSCSPSRRPRRRAAAAPSGRRSRTTTCSAAEHRRRDLAGERAGVLRIHVLRADRVRQPVRVDQRLDRAQRRERRDRSRPRRARRRRGPGGSSASGPSGSPRGASCASSSSPR